MTPEKKPFTSGLPGGDPKPLDQRGYALLMRNRERAEQDLRVLTPLQRTRYDGTERLEPDAEDIEAFEIAEATKRLVDIILSDRDLARTVATRMSTFRGRPR